MQDASGVFASSPSHSFPLVAIIFDVTRFSALWATLSQTDLGLDKRGFGTAGSGDEQASGHDVHPWYSALLTDLLHSK